MGIRRKLKGIKAQLNSIQLRLINLQKGEEKMANDLDALTSQVKQNTDAEQSAIVLLNGLSAQIASLKNDPVAIQALADQLKGSAASLSAAVVANTPAAS